VETARQSTNHSKNIMGIFVLAIFRVSVGFAFFVLSKKTAVAFTALWVFGVYVTIVLRLIPWFFLAYEALLAACLCVMLKLEWS
jgi:hypothetical protein